MATRQHGGPISRWCQRKQQKISGKQRCLIRINRLCARLCCNRVTEAITGLTRGNEKARSRSSTCQSKNNKTVSEPFGPLNHPAEFRSFAEPSFLLPGQLCATMRCSAR